MISPVTQSMMQRPPNPTELSLILTLLDLVYIDCIIGWLTSGITYLDKKYKTGREVHKQAQISLYILRMLDSDLSPILHTLMFVSEFIDKIHDFKNCSSNSKLELMEMLPSILSSFE